jgi:hypothetical protein
MIRKTNQEGEKHEKSIDIGVGVLYAITVRRQPDGSRRYKVPR